MFIQVTIVDLAGSENLSQSGSSTGEQRTEAVKINQSLLSLTRFLSLVGNAASKKGPGAKMHPATVMRESALTRLLYPRICNHLGKVETYVVFLVCAHPVDLSGKDPGITYLHTKNALQQAKMCKLIPVVEKTNAIAAAEAVAVASLQLDNLAAVAESKGREYQRELVQLKNRADELNRTNEGYLVKVSQMEKLLENAQQLISQNLGDDVRTLLEAAGERLGPRLLTKIRRSGRQLQQRHAASNVDLEVLRRDFNKLVQLIDGPMELDQKRTLPARCADVTKAAEAYYASIVELEGLSEKQGRIMGKAVNQVFDPRTKPSKKRKQLARKQKTAAKAAKQKQKTTQKHNNKTDQTPGGSAAVHVTTDGDGDGDPAIEDADITVPATATKTPAGAPRKKRLKVSVGRAAAARRHSASLPEPLGAVKVEFTSRKPLPSGNARPRRRHSMADLDLRELVLLQLQELSSSIDEDVLGRSIKSLQKFWAEEKQPKTALHTAKMCRVHPGHLAKFNSTSRAAIEHAAANSKLMVKAASDQSAVTSAYAVIQALARFCKALAITFDMARLLAAAECRHVDDGMRAALVVITKRATTLQQDNTALASRSSLLVTELQTMEEATDQVQQDVTLATDKLRQKIDAEKRALARNESIVGDLENKIENAAVYYSFGYSNRAVPPAATLVPPIAIPPSALVLPDDEPLNAAEVAEPADGQTTTCRSVPSQWRHSGITKAQRVGVPHTIDQAVRKTWLNMAQLLEKSPAQKVPLGKGFNRTLLPRNDPMWDEIAKRVEVGRHAYYDPLTGEATDEVFSMKVESVYTLKNSKLEARFYRRCAELHDPSFDGVHTRFHGTSERNVGSIAKAGFRMPAHAGLFGKALYSSNDAAKAAMYCEGGGTMFVVRVALGKYKALKSSFRSPDALSAKKVHGLYDSVYASPEVTWGGFTEFMVYHKDQMYPLYEIKFRHIRSNTPGVTVAGGPAGGQVLAAGGLAAGALVQQQKLRARHAAEAARNSKLTAKLEELNLDYDLLADTFDDLEAKEIFHMVSIEADIEQNTSELAECSVRAVLLETAAQQKRELLADFAAAADAAKSEPTEDIDAFRNQLHRQGLDASEIELELQLFTEVSTLQTNMALVRQALRLFDTDSRVSTRDRNTRRRQTNNRLADRHRAHKRRSVRDERSLDAEGIVRLLQKERAEVEQLEVRLAEAVAAASVIQRAYRAHRRWVDGGTRGVVEDWLAKWTHATPRLADIVKRADSDGSDSEWTDSDWTDGESDAGRPPPQPHPPRTPPQNNQPTGLSSTAAHATGGKGGHANGASGGGRREMASGKPAAASLGESDSDLDSDGGDPAQTARLKSPLKAPLKAPDLAANSGSGSDSEPDSDDSW